MQCKIVSLASLITAGFFCIFCYFYLEFSPQFSSAPTSRILESGKIHPNLLKSKPSANCESVAAKLCSIPECVIQSFSPDSKLTEKIHRSIKNSKSIKIVHRHGTRIAFSAPDTKSCGRQYAPTELENSEYFKNVTNYPFVFQFSKKNGTDGQCAHSMLTGHGALQLFENGKLFKSLSKNAEWADNKFNLKSSRYARTIGSLVSFAVGYGIKHDSRLSEFDISHEYGKKVPSECSPIVRKYEEANGKTTGKGSKDERDYKKYKRRKAAVKNNGLCDSENFQSISGVLSDICHETQTSFMQNSDNSDNFSNRFTPSCNDTNYFHRQQFMTKYCTRDLSIMRQYFILEKLNSKTTENTLWSLHDVNLVDLWCIFFWEKDKDDCPPPISYAAFMLFTDSMVIFSNQNHLAAVDYNFMENPIKFTNKSIVGQIKNATRCYGLLEQFI